MGRRPSARHHPVTPIPEGNFIPFRPRSYQRPLVQAFSIDMETKRPRTRHGIWVMHRRGGKDVTAALGVCLPAMAMLPGNYWHIFPKFAQAKKAIWHEEETFLDRFPPHWKPRRLETEMYVELTVPPHNKKARYYLLGADDTETVSKLVGTAPRGVTYSEAALMDETVRRLIRPALAENMGWELLISTPRGKNWFHKLWLMAMENPSWFAEPVITVEHTRRDSETDRTLGRYGEPVIPLEEIEEDRVAGMTAEEIDQEYYCSWEGYRIGTIYGDLLRHARTGGRIGRCPYDPRKPVGIMLDIGRSDLTAVWFYQVHASEIRFIDYWANRGETSTTTIRFLKEQKPYSYARIVLPHDAKEQRYQASESVVTEFRRAFRGHVVVSERFGVQAGINAVRKFFPRFYFDEVTCGAELGPNIPSGLDSMGNYRRKWDDERKTYSVDPVHDQFSHGADALRVGMMTFQEGLEFSEERGPPEPTKTDFQRMFHPSHPGTPRRARTLV